MKMRKIKDQKSTGDLFGFVYRHAGYGIALMTHKWKFLTPNRISWLSLFFALMASVAFSFGGRFFSLLVAVISLQISIILDYLDGSLARLRKEETVLGNFLDGSIDGLKFPIILVGYAIGSRNYVVVILGLLLVSIKFFRVHSIVMYKNLEIIPDKSGLNETNIHRTDRNLKSSMAFIKRVWRYLALGGWDSLYFFLSLGAVLSFRLWALVFMCIVSGITAASFFIPTSIKLGKYTPTTQEGFIR